MNSFSPPMDTTTQPEQFQDLAFKGHIRAIDANGLENDTEVSDEKGRGLNGAKIDQK